MKRALPAVAACYIALTLLASFFWKGELWGLGSWGFLSPYIALGLALVLVPQLFLRAPLDPFERFPRIRSRSLELLAAAAVSIAALWLLRARHELWGEQAALADALAKGDYRWSAPLSTFLQWGLYRFTNVIFFWSPRTVLAITSIAAGALYTIAAIRGAGLFTGARGSDGARAVSAAILLSNGFIVLFFGGGGAMAITALLVLLFLLVEIEFLRGHRSLALPTLLLIAAILSHVSALYLLPGYAYSAVVGIRSPASRRSSAWSVALVAAAVLILELAFPLAAGKPGPLGQLLAAASSTLGSLDISPARLAALLRDGCNELFLIGPASVIALCLLVARGSAAKTSAHGEGTCDAPAGSLTPAGEGRGAASVFLPVTAAAACLAVAAAAGRVDGGLRWYAAAATGPAFAVSALWLLGSRLADRESFRKAAFICAALGLFHTIPWIIVNASPAVAERRLLALPLEPGRGEMIAGEAALARNDLSKAHAAYLASIAEDSTNVAAQVAAGTIEMRQREFAAAIAHFSNAHELAPEVPRYRFLLAEALIENRWFPEAIRNLESLTAAYPESVAFWRKLGFALNNSGRCEAAVPVYERALALEPANEENLRNLVSALLNRGAQLQTEKRYAEAEALYERVVDIYPDEWRAFNNRAVIEMRQERWKRAEEILAEALAMHPFESSLHFNMGIVLEKLGRNREALDHLLSARQLDPVDSTAETHIARLEKKLGLWKEAQSDSQRSP